MTSQGNRGREVANVREGLHRGRQLLTDLTIDPADVPGATEQEPTLDKTDLLQNQTDIEAKIDIIDTLVDTLTTNLATLTTNVATVDTKLGRKYSTFTYWSDVQETVTISTVAATKSLPGVAVADLPSGATIIRVLAVFKFREVSDTSGTLNDLNAACGVNIEIKKSTSCAWVDAINLVDQQFQVPASERGPGDVLVGDLDLTCEVDDNATYNAQIEAVTSTGSNLILRDVQVGLIVMWQ